MDQWLAITLLAAAGLGSAAYIAVYTRYADWWRTEIGWSLVGFPGVLGLLAINGLVFRLLGDYPGRHAVNVALWLVWVAVVWWLTSLVYRSNHSRKGRNPRMADKPSPAIGTMVHYTSYGTPGGEYPSVCRAAIVTAVDRYQETSDDGTFVGHVDLAVLNPEGMFFNKAVRQDEGAETPGDPNCPERHGKPFRYCSTKGCGWREASRRGGTWHWPHGV